MKTENWSSSQNENWRQNLKVLKIQTEDSSTCPTLSTSHTGINSLSYWGPSAEHARCAGHIAEQMFSVFKKPCQAVLFQNNLIR